MMPADEPQPPPTATSDLHLQGLLEDYYHSDDDVRANNPSMDPSGARPPSNAYNATDSAVLESGGSLAFLNSIAIIIGLQIGSGIFSAPAYVSAHVPSPGIGILVWLLSGLLVWTGASTFAELGAALPRNGGIQEYLRYCYGDFAGFMFSWIWVSIARPCTMGMISLVFAEHVNGIMLPEGWAGGWVDTATALMGLWLITLANCLDVNMGARVANWFLVLKLFAIFSIAGIGVVIGLKGDWEGVGENGLRWFGTGHSVTQQEVRSFQPRDGEPGLWVQFGEYVTALFAALWVYGGWEAVSSPHVLHHLEKGPTPRCIRGYRFLTVPKIGFFAGEMKDPSRNLRRVMNVAMSKYRYCRFCLDESCVIYCVADGNTTRDGYTCCG
jgi:Amino acid permease